MKKLMIVLTDLIVFSIAAFAQMGNGQGGGGGMMGGGNWGWGMGYGLWRGVRDHYRDSRYFWCRIYDETKVKM
jgi:hypothetical protein